MDHIVRGVRFNLYTLLRKKRTCTKIAYYVGRRRTFVTFRGDLDAAKEYRKTLVREAEKNFDVSATALSPLDRRIYAIAKETCGKLGRDVDTVCRDYLEAARILGPGTTVLEAARTIAKAQRLLGDVTIMEAVREWRRLHVDEFCEHHRYQDVPASVVEVSRLPELPPVSGVYFAWCDGRVVYVGQSRNLGRRCVLGKKHPSLQVGDKLSWVEEPTSRLRLAEAFYIGILQPAQNLCRSGSKPAPATSVMKLRFQPK